jgi:hypothetical protein
VMGRCGLAKEGMNALVTGAIAELGEHIAAASPGCQALHVDWPAWSEDALGQQAERPEAMTRAGFTAMPVSEGSRLLLKVLATDDLPRRVAIHGRVGVPAPRCATPGQLSSLPAVRPVSSRQTDPQIKPTP